MKGPNIKHPPRKQLTKEIFPPYNRLVKILSFCTLYVVISIDSSILFEENGWILYLFKIEIFVGLILLLYSSEFVILEMLIYISFDSFF